MSCSSLRRSMNGRVASVLRRGPDSTTGMGSSRPRPRGSAFGSPFPLADLEDAQRRLGFVRHHLGAPRRTEHELRPYLAETVDRREERADLVLDQRADRTAHRRQAVSDVDVAVVLHIDLVHEAEIDDVDAELRVVDLHQRLADVLLRHGRNAALRGCVVCLGLDVIGHAVSRRPSGICLATSVAQRERSQQGKGTADVASIRALIVDDHPVTREGLRTALELSDDVIVVVGEAATGEEAVEQARSLTPDVVFMDVRMPGMDGIEATRRIKDAAPSTKVILITVDESRGAVSEAIQAGVSGYLLKDATPDALVDAARNAVEGNAVIHPHLTKTFIEEASTAGDEPRATPLSKREREILQKVADGATTRQVASDLGISPHTVKTHLERIFEKLGANDRAQAVAIAIRTGIVR